MDFRNSKELLKASTRAAGILALTLAAIFAWKTQAAFAQQSSTQNGNSAASTSGLPPLIAAPSFPSSRRSNVPARSSLGVASSFAKPSAAYVGKPAAGLHIAPATPSPATTVPASAPPPTSLVAVPAPAAPANPADAEPAAEPPAESPANLPQESAALQSVYRIGVDDVLNVSVWQEPDLSRTVPVRPDGKISLPLVGDVTAAGKSAMQLQAEVKLQLAKFVKNPELTVIVVEIRSRRVNVMGQVARPGTFPLTQSMGVLEALAAAGGLRDFAKKKDIYVLRMSPDGKRERVSYAYEDVLKGKPGSRELMLQPRDTVVVP